MMDAAKARIANRDADGCETEEQDSAFSWRGFVIAILIILAIAVSVLVVGWLLIANG